MNTDYFTVYLDEHELVHGLIPLQKHHTGLQSTAQEHTASLHVTNCSIGGKRTG